MGKTNSLSGICNRISISPIPSKRSKMDNSSRGPTSVTLGRNKSNVTKRGYSRDNKSIKRVLLNVFPSTQTRRESKTNSKSETVKPVCKGSEVQNVYTTDNNPHIASGGLVGIDRFEGRLLSRPDNPETQTLSPICVSGENISVQRVTIRPINSPKSLYKDIGSSCRNVAREGSTSLPLSRRLFDCGQNTNSISSFGSVDYTGFGSSRFCYKHQEIAPPSSPEATISRSSIGHSPSVILSSQGSSSGAETSSPGIQTRCQENCETVSSPARSDGCSNLDDSVGQVEDETDTDISQYSMESQLSTSRLSHFDSPVVSRSCKLVDRSFQSDPGFTLEKESPNRSSYYRRKQKRLGRSFTFRKSARTMEVLSKKKTHKSIRTAGSVQFLENFSAASQRSNSISPDRQHNGSPLHKQFRRHQIARNVQFDNRNDQLVYNEKHRSGSNSHSGPEQFISRCPVPQISPLPQLGTIRQSSSQVVSEVDNSTDRSVCYDGEQETSRVLFPSILSSGNEHRRSQSRLVGNVRVRFPACAVDKADTIESGDGEDNDDFDSSEVVQEGMVSHSPGSPDRLSCQAAPNQGSSDTRTGPSAASQSSGVTTHGLVDQRNRLLARGLSEQATETLMASRSESTNKSYQSGWKMFSKWCESRDDDPNTTSVSVIINYLQELLTSGLSYNTISARVNAIQAFHARYRDKGSLRTHYSMATFLQGAYKRYMPVKDRVPSWDLPTVLQGLKRAPFEPMDTIPLNLLTLKTVFLLGICSAKRIGELRSLDCRPAFCSVGVGGIVLRPNPHFIPKVPSIENVEQTLEFSPFGKDVRKPEGTDRALCVCRAVRIYLSRTKNFRDTDQFFVTFKKGAQGRPVTTQTIATWLKKAISLAYQFQGKSIDKGYKAHSVRGTSCSWADVKCASILAICKQACWQSSNTFVKHYKLDVARTVSERHGQLVLQASHENENENEDEDA